MLWTRHCEATREQQENSIETQRTTFKQTQINNIHFKNNERNRQTLKNKKRNCIHFKSNRIKKQKKVQTLILGVNHQEIKTLDIHFVEQTL